MENKKDWERIVNYSQVILVFIVVVGMDLLASFITTQNGWTDFAEKWEDPNTWIKTMIKVSAAIMIKVSVYRLSKSEAKHGEYNERESLLNSLWIKITHKKRIGELEQHNTNYNRTTGLTQLKTKLSNSLTKERKNKKAPNISLMKELEEQLDDVDSAFAAVDKNDKITLLSLSKKGIDVDNLDVKFDKMSNTILFSGGLETNQVQELIDRSDARFARNFIKPIIITFIISFVTSSLLLESSENWMTILFGFLTSLFIVVWNAGNGWFGGINAVNKSSLPLINFKINYLMQFLDNEKQQDSAIAAAEYSDDKIIQKFKIKRR